jgi:hypothetical protein
VKVSGNDLDAALNDPAACVARRHVAQSVGAVLAESGSLISSEGIFLDLIAGLAHRPSGTATTKR